MRLTTSVARRLYPWGTTRTVIFGPARGMRFIVRPGMGASYALGMGHKELPFLRQRIQPGDVVYDLGANRGQMALFFARWVGTGGTVVAAEPVPETVLDLRRNMQLNNLQHVQVLDVAVTDSVGTVTFLTNPASDTQGKIAGLEPTYTDPGAQEILVKATTVDTLVADGYPAPALMKIDVEGGARALLRGARQTIEQYSPSIYIELHGPEEQLGVAEELLENGYIVETLDGARVDDPVTRWVNPLWCYRS